MAEIWKPVVGYEGFYEVSNFGQVRNAINLRIRKPQERADGRYEVLLCTNYKKRMFKIHRLVATAFCTGDSSLQVNHKDGNFKNNHAENLEWLTDSENKQHARKVLGIRNNSSMKAIRLKKDEEIITFSCLCDAADHLGVCAGSVSSAAKNNHRVRGYRAFFV